jgi:hypothetical protein
MIGLPRKTIFIDRNSGGRAFKATIVKAGINVVLHDDQFPQRTEDHIWLKKVGALGYAIVTGDVAVERSFLFLDTLKRSRAHVFVICELNHSDANGRAKRIIDAYASIIELCHMNKGPALWKAKTGHAFVAFDFRHQLGLLKRKLKTGDVHI